jgi:hypothetical protein
VTKEQRMERSRAVSARMPSQLKRNPVWGEAMHKEVIETDSLSAIRETMVGRRARGEKASELME